MVLTHDVPCRACGYNLRGLSTDGRCPECGQGIGRSLVSDSLTAADGGWVRRVALGLGLLKLGAICGLVLAPLLILLLIFLHLRFLSNLLLAVLLVGAALAIPGAWLVTLREPGVLRRDRWLPNVAPLAMTLGLPASVLALNGFSWFPQGVGLMLAGATLATGIAGILLHLAGLARRARDEKVATLFCTLAILSAMCGLLLLVPQALAFVFGPPKPPALPLEIVTAVGLLLSPSVYAQLRRLRAAMMASGPLARKRR
ncbi:MAG TPA: hypothetical protein VHQ47_10490 [Phycisphaerae bacterium]|nr:hypothetical protein [Phycisphaerae bacterium]